jgi:integrase
LRRARNSEVCALDLGDQDFAHGVIHVRDAKTEAGARQVNMTPWLRDELLVYRGHAAERRADRSRVPHPDRVTPGQGQRQSSPDRARRAGRHRVRAERGESPLPAQVTAHTFRRTFITLMLEAGAPVPIVQGQVGHEEATTTLKICAHVVRRRDRRHHGQAFDALMTNAVPSPPTVLMSSQPDHLRDWDGGPTPHIPGGSGHRNEQNQNL